VIGPNDVILVMGNRDIPPLWLTGYVTKGLADGDDVHLLGPVEVSGTKSYSTVTGAKKTVRVIRFLDRARLEEIEADVRKLAAAKEKAIEESKAKMREAMAAEDARRRAVEEKQFRMWKSASGKFSVEAKFVTFSGGRVYLKKRDGSLINVSNLDLSQADIEYTEVLKTRKVSNH
jgi:hypothetical protein